MFTKNTEIIFLLDRSGSMGPLTDSTIRGYNDFIREQSIPGAETKVTTILFDDQYEVLYNGVPVQKAYLNHSQYYTRGSTALYDAVARAITDVSIRLMRTPAHSQPEKVIMVITTDGRENASKEFSELDVQTLITNKRKMDGWNFLFFGANIDVKEAAAEIGIEFNDAFPFEATPSGVENMMCDCCEAVFDIIGSKD